MDAQAQRMTSIGFGSAIGAYLYLQMLDFVTTVIGLQLGLSEASPFVRGLITVHPVAGVLVAKLLACLLAVYCVWKSKLQILRLANYWFAALVAWNLFLIFWRLR